MTNWRSDLDAFIEETKALLKGRAPSAVSLASTMLRKSGAKFVDAAAIE